MVDENFLIEYTKSSDHKEKKNKLNFSRIQNFCSAKDNIKNKKKKQAKEYWKILKNTDVKKDLHSKNHKEIM